MAGAGSPPRPLSALSAALFYQHFSNAFNGTDSFPVVQSHFLTVCQKEYAVIVATDAIERPPCLTRKSELVFPHIHQGGPLAQWKYQKL